MKKQFRKTEGRGYYHIVQAFAPDDPLDFTTAHELGVKLAEHFEGYQCIVVTHMNTAHIHNHIIMNSVNFETGVKFHQSAREMQQVKDYCSQLCREYGLPVSCITEASCCRSWWSGISPAVRNGKITRKNMSSITVSI